MHKLYATARLITGTRRRDHITPVLHELHWLPIWERVKFKVACLVRQSLSGQAPLYLADDCCLVSDSARRSLRSADVPTCVVPRTYSSYGDRTFAAAGPHLWTLFLSSCAIHTSAMDCLDDSWRDIFLANHERGALWLLDMWRLRKTLTYLLTYLREIQWANCLISEWSRIWSVLLRTYTIRWFRGSIFVNLGSRRYWNLWLATSRVWSASFSITEITIGWWIAELLVGGVVTTTEFNSLLYKQCTSWQLHYLCLSYNCNQACSVR